MGNAHPRIINCSGIKCYYMVDSNRRNLQEQTIEVSGAYMGVELSVADRRRYETRFGRNGWGVCPVDSIGAAQAPDEDDGRGLYISVIDADGVVYANGQPWNPECGSFWNIVIGDDDAIHQGYKNKRYRCRGQPNFFGGERCDGCRQRVCRDPKEFGTDGWCGQGSMANEFH